MRALDAAMIGRALRTQREQLRMTQEQAAHLAGVSHRLWSEVERGARPNVSLETTIRMLQTLGLDLFVHARQIPATVGAPPARPTVKEP